MRIWQFLGGVVLAYLVGFVFTFLAVGVAWDPRRMRLLGTPLEETWQVVLAALTQAVPLAVTSFVGAHPVVVTMGLGFVLLLLVGLVGLGEKAGRRTVYALAIALAAIGVVRFFLP